MADKSFHSFMNTVNPQHFLSVLWVLGPRAGCWWLGTERRALHRRGSQGVGETLRSILCTKAVAEALCPHPVLPHPPWPIHLCPLPVALSSWPGQGALCPPPPPAAISCPPVICFLWSFCPETSGSLWTIGNLGYLLPWARPGLLTPLGWGSKWASLGMLPWEADGSRCYSFIHSFIHRSQACVGPTKWTRHLCPCPHGAPRPRGSSPSHTKRILPRASPAVVVRGLKEGALS